MVALKTQRGPDEVAGEQAEGPQSQQPAWGQEGGDLEDEGLRAADQTAIRLRGFPRGIPRIIPHSDLKFDRREWQDDLAAVEKANARTPKQGERRRPHEAVVRSAGRTIVQPDDHVG